MSKPEPVPRPITWAVGVTTVPSRREDLLVQTLHSLCDAGFGDPHLFVDGCDDPSLYKDYATLVSCRPNPPVKIVGNWVMGMWELYVRNPTAHRIAMFQDDVQVISNLHEYLDSCEYPDRGYWNLYTHNENQKHTNNQPGWQRALQRGLGAVGLVFDRKGLQTLLTTKLLAGKPASANKTKSYKSIDGGISQGMKNEGYTEYVHNPSLVQHWGLVSTLKNKQYPPVSGFSEGHLDLDEWTREQKIRG